MNLEFWKSLAGMVTAEFTGAVPEDTLDAITGAKIPVSHVVKRDELTYEIQIPRKDLGALTRILNKRGNGLKIVRKQGIYWDLAALVRRPVLVLLLTVLLGSALWLPSRIFFFAVDGNERIPDRLILAAAEECGIRFGASRKDVRSERMKNALLSALPQLQWAGINTSGCRAVISVRERMEEPVPAEEKTVSNLIADRDGYLLSVTVTGGTPKVQPGQAVTKGQLLVSGYTDCGICIRASRAEGEIFAQTRRKIQAVMPDTCLLVRSDPETKYAISLLCGKKRINLWKDSRISDACCGRMYQEYYLSLPGGFRLPLAVCVDAYRYSVLGEGAVPEETALQQLRLFSDNYLTQQMIAGQILERQQLGTRSGGLYSLDSSYVCTEMIGREQREQIGDFNGKRN